MTRLSGYGTVDLEHVFTRFTIIPRRSIVWYGIQVETALPAVVQTKQSKFGTRTPSSCCSTILPIWVQSIHWPSIPGIVRYTPYNGYADCDVTAVATSCSVEALIPQSRYFRL
jgi:hypothetical protein